MTDRAAAVPSDDERNWRRVTGPPARLSRSVPTFPISSDGAPGSRDELDRRLSYRLAARSEIRNPAKRSDHVQFLRKTELPEKSRSEVAWVCQDSGKFVLTAAYHRT